ncbi:MAG: cobyric acid synthase [Firmicutes bacterium]|nr:cobyric acid synthase [Bacillota bacterium]
MIQGTASSVGKSLLTAAICRILKQDGLKVAPFKSQNMSLNSFITREGGEMGRAQVVQAEACGIEPHVTMNPILLKPTADQRSQVIVLGKVYDNLSAAEYYQVRPTLRDTVRQAYQRLADEYDVIVIEGAGSPAEINLQADDLVNMGMAGMVDAPVLLVGDIDRGGVFASVAGTVWLLPEEDRRRVKGVIINKFRGDVEILRPGLVQLEKLISVPVLGVVPYLDVQIDEEDAAVNLLEQPPGNGTALGKDSIHIDVVRLPRISNFTDFAALERQPGVVLRYVRRPGEIANPDLVIIPGSKNTIGDLEWLRESGIAGRILEHHRQGGCLMGVCGGYQMLGREIQDPFHTESEKDRASGLGLLDVVTVFAEEKVTVQVKGEVLPAGCLLQGMAGVDFEGYEIHLGRSDLGKEAEPALLLEHPNGVRRREGAVSPSGRVLGVYVHGFFDSPTLARGLVNNLRLRRGLTAAGHESIDPDRFKQREYDRLAAAVRHSLDLEKVYQIAGI